MWRKSSLSAVNNCLEADGPWVTSSESNPSGNCVSVQWHAACSAGGSCLEVGFQAASACESAACVEAAYQPASGCANVSCVETADENDGLIRVRDSKQWKEDGPEGPILVYPVSEWDEGRVVVFMPVERSEVPVDVLDLREDGSPEAQWYVVPGWLQDGTTARLYFDRDEVDAYKGGIKAGDFELAAA